MLLGKAARKFEDLSDEEVKTFGMYNCENISYDLNKYDLTW